MKQELAIAVALLLFGSLAQTVELAAGESAALGACILTLDDYASTKALFSIDCGDGATTFYLAPGESREIPSGIVKLDALAHERASLSLTEIDLTNSPEEALGIAAPFITGYPAESVTVEEGDCNGGRGWGECWLVSAHRTVAVPANNGLPGFERNAGAIVYVTRDGSIQRVLEVT
ncbi:MAG: hypothetical protein WC607_04920 [Candidatus Micrarchaeia archaeon]